MVRWSSFLPSVAQAKEEIDAATEVLQKIASKILPPAPQMLGLDSGKTGALALSLVIVGASAFLLQRNLQGKKKLRSIQKVLEEDPDLQVFLGYWKALPEAGPWDKPNLDMLRQTEKLVLLAPTNAAFQEASGDIFPLQESSWRKLLVTHVIATQLDRDSFEQSDEAKSFTDIAVPLNVIRFSHSDGTTGFKVPLEASNGWIYKIDHVLIGGRLEVNERLM